MPLPASLPGGKPPPLAALAAPFGALFPRLVELKQWYYKVPAADILLIPGAHQLPSLFCSKAMFYLGNC